MTDQKVEEYPDLRKVDGCFVVNTNRREYLKALARQKKEREDAALKDKVASLEDKIDLIIKLLSNGKDD